MSETSSDSESCGWTIISNEGSDIEMLGPEATVEYGGDMPEPPLVEKVESQQTPTSASAVCDEQLDGALDEPLGEQAAAEPHPTSEAAGTEMDSAATQCFSDHSDIVTLGDLREGEDATVAPAAASEEFYLGRSCSSQYAFTAAETVFSAQQFAATHSSSSEDEVAESPSTTVRRRRLRKNTNSSATEPEEEEPAESEPSEEEDEEAREEEAGEEEQQGECDEIKGTAQKPSSGSSILNRCILIALVIAISMGYGHFHGTLQVQERQKMVEKVRVNELDGKKDLLNLHKLLQQEVVLGNSLQSRLQQLRSELKQVAVTNQWLKNKLRREEQLLLAKSQELRNLRRLEDGNLLLSQRLSAELEEKRRLERQQEEQSLLALQEELRNLRSSVQQRLEAAGVGADLLQMENQRPRGKLEEWQQPKNSQEKKEQSLSALGEELRNLRSSVQHLEATGPTADSLLMENRRLSSKLEEEKQLALRAHRQMKAAMMEAQELRWNLEVEKKVTEELRSETAQLRSRLPTDGPDVGELQSRVVELEKRLSFEQQRSDLWERLYVETKEDRAKGDTEAKVKKPKRDMVGKVKETFDAIKNSTKEFVHHHKEQIKKVKEAVKENLRKFSDSVKSLPTFYQWKDSAASFINKARGFYKKTDEQAARPPRGHLHGFGESFQSNHNTRKPGHKVNNERGHKVNLDGCSGMHECTFEQAMEPVRADEFHQLLQSYLQQQVDHFHHWKELEAFVNSFFFNGVFIHDRMLFTDFISGVEDYLADMHEYHGLDEDVFGDLDDYVYRHYFGEAYAKSHGPSGPFERHDDDSREETRTKQQRKQQRATKCKLTGTRRKTHSRMADVKIELGPMPFDPKY